VSARLDALCFDANDTVGLARFWAAALGWEENFDIAGVVRLVPTDGTRFNLDFLPTRERKQGKNRIHLDLNSTSVEEQRETVRRLLDLGARPIDIGQGPDCDHAVLADPEGNEFCVVQPGNFVADGGFVGSITCDASGPAVGYFWSEALGWPLVWDQDEETAIRAPDGTGQFITFGPPLPPKHGKNRLHIDIAPPADRDQLGEVDRLVALGARRVDIGQRDVDWVVMADPDDNEFCVLTPR
jgi:catechol 2,3-dioxygenase-like lactoylglutathione lyase family enzyme